MTQRRTAAPGLFDGPDERGPTALAPGALLLPGFALPGDAALMAAVRAIAACSPFRHMETRGGYRMSVAMTSAGSIGWVTDRRGYRYDAVDPETGAPWPPMPAVFRRISADGAAAAGFDGFVPDTCLINRYDPGARMSLHQDRDERDFAHPIVSVSLGIPATFLFGGTTRDAQPLCVSLSHGDVVVWGGPARLRYHGVLPLRKAEHPLVGPFRINLTFRRAG